MGNKKYYFQIKKETPQGERWITPQRGYYTFPSGVWTEVIVNKKKYADKEKRILVRDYETSEILHKIKITNGVISFFESSRRKHLNKKGEYLYDFQVETETDCFGVPVKEWISPINAKFDSLEKLWKYIIRNRIHCVGYSMRIITENKDGKEVNISEISVGLIETMEINKYGDF